MRRKLAAGLVGAALVAMVLVGRAAAQQDAWAGVDRIVAVGDVHGDYEQFVRTLRAAGVVDAANKWIAGKTHLVQLGDILGRGAESRKAMDLVMGLEPQAAEAGGAVHALIGNHEAMELLGDWRYVNPEDEKAYGGEEGLRTALGPQGRYGRWIRKHSTVININDILFVHAGLTPALARRSAAEINRTVRDELLRGVQDGIAAAADGPLWDRSLVVDDEDEVAKRLEGMLKAYGARRMVVGHTVSPEGVSARAGGRLVMIDVGLSKLYGGPAACLVVEKGTLYEVRHPGVKRKLPLEAPAKAPAASRVGSISCPVYPRQAVDLPFRLRAA
jgi:hypothetical protein